MLEKLIKNEELLNTPMMRRLRIMLVGNKKTLPTLPGLVFFP
jgi:hypothetical protein